MNYSQLVFNILLVLIYIKHSSSVQFVPPNRIVPAIQNDRYYFGLEDDGELEIERCTGTSDTGIRHSFLVRPAYFNGQIGIEDMNFSPYFNENMVIDRGVEGLCQIVVLNVQDTGPKVWTLVALGYDNEVLLNTTFTVDFYYKGPLLEYNIRVMETASFINYIMPNTTAQYVSCYLYMNNTIKIDLDIHTRKTNVFLSVYTERAEDLTNRITSVGHGYCGFRFVNATNELKAMEWSLSARDEDGVPYRGIFNTRIDAKTSENNLHLVKNVRIGTQHSLACGWTPISSSFCSIFNPKGKLVEATKCTHIIPSFGMEHVGLWKCYSSGLGNNMRPLEYTIELHNINPERVISWTNETESYVNIGCAVENYGGRTVNYCKMVAPNEDMFNVRPFLATERYLTLGTNFQRGACAIMIKKPLQNYEKGLWRCELKLEYATVTGTHIAVQTAQPATYVKHLSITTRHNKPFTILCNVPYYSPYCRIRAPNGTNYQPDEAREVPLGRCYIHVEHSTPSDNGTWVCSFARQTGEPDDDITVNVVVAEVLSYFKNVEADVGDSITLMCTSGGLPLEYCRFISPHGVGYHLDDRINNPSGITYVGKGLDYGECGIQIPNIKVTDSGNWACVTKLVIDDEEDENNELRGLMMVDIASPLSGPNIAAIGIGTAVGIVIVTVVLGIVAKQRWNRRRHIEVEGTVNPSSRRSSSNGSSQNSGSNIFNMESPPRVYRNPQALVMNDEEYNVFNMEQLPPSNEPGPSRSDEHEEEHRL